MPDPGGQRPQYLETGPYRQRRMRDAGRMLPIFAIVFCLLPMLWPRQGGADHLTSTGLIYLFGLWVVLIVIAALLTRALRNDETQGNNADGPDPSER